MWNLYLSKYIKLLEDVQRRDTKLVQRIEDWSYEERLQF